MARNYEAIYTHSTEPDERYTHPKYISKGISDMLSFLVSSKASVY